jgi:hypothetical protein
LPVKRRIYWRVGKDSGFFDDLKTLTGALRRLERRVPFASEWEAQFDHPVGSDVALRESAGLRGGV